MTVAGLDMDVVILCIAVLSNVVPEAGNCDS